MSRSTRTKVLAPESLLDGTPATGLSPAEAGQLANLKTGLAHWSAQVKLYARAGVAAQAMAGLHLRGLRVLYFGERNPKGGRPKKPDTVSGFPTWTSLLEEEAGITERTAERWMKIADAVEAMAEREGADVIAICQKLPWEWTPEESAQIGQTVHKLTEDKTQRELLQADFLPSLGFTPPDRINSSNNPLGKNGGKKKPAANPQQLLKERQQAARLVFLGTDKPGRVEQGSVAMFMTRFVNDAGAEMEALPQAELRDLYEHTVKPFAAAFRKLAAL